LRQLFRPDSSTALGAIFVEFDRAGHAGKGNGRDMMRFRLAETRGGPRQEFSLVPTLVAGLVALAQAVPAVVHAQSAENVAVVINEASDASIRVGEYYARQRGIPAENIIRIRTSLEDGIDPSEYGATIDTPIAAALARERLQDRILYLVLTKGIPLRISGSMGRAGTHASVDSELTLLYRRMTGRGVLTRGHVDNPYYLGDRDVGGARPFTHRDHDIYLVSRLDGFTVDDVIALIDRASRPTPEGRIVLDQRGGPASSLGDGWLIEAERRLAAAGYAERVLLEATGQPVRNVAQVMGYYSWGATDPQNRVRRYDLGFVPGAIAATFGGADARTMREPPAQWRPPTNPMNRAAWFEGSPHSLVGDLIREGATGVAGYVAEPYFESVVRPEVLFNAYLAGHNLIESFYLALPHLGWQAVVIGDPLCAPFPRKAAEAADLRAELDSQTGLPVFFSGRRAQAFADANPGVSRDAAASWVRSVDLRDRGDLEGARRALEQTLEKAPNGIGPRLELARNHELRDDIDAANEEYRKILELQPRQVVALNNLAYSLAVRRGRPAEALPFARRAATLSPQNASILDTLAWVEHLLGDNLTASKRLADAIRRDPTNAEIRLHAAIVYGALAVRTLAETELKEAVRLNPAYEESEQVKELRQRLARMQDR
jgi:uncharacterized protein (TIGR03790 family)